MKRTLRYASRLLILALCLVFIASPNIAIAQDAFDEGFTEQDLKDINNQTPWYGPSLDGCTVTASAANFTGNNERDAFRWFLDPGRGLTAHQSAGIIGNLIQESGVNPRSNQANGPGMGIAQWSEGGRWEELKAYVAEKNLGDIYSLSAQLEFLWHEMNNVAPWKETLPLLKQVVPGATITDGDAGLSGYKINNDNDALYAATVIFERKFEKAGIPAMDKRVANAKRIFNQYGRLDGGSPTTDRPADEGLCGDGTIQEGSVNSQGYAWPVGDGKKHSYGTAPCKSRTCHHDGTPAFDLMYGQQGNMDGRPVYAITNGTIVKQSIYHGVRGCYAIQFKSDIGNGKGSYYYWYGHLQNPRFKQGEKPGAGKQIAEVGRNSLGPNCRGGRDHLHIDRGCIAGGIPQTGGGKSCRDPAFVPLINKLWEELPE